MTGTAGTDYWTDLDALDAEVQVMLAAADRELGE